MGGDRIHPRQSKGDGGSHRKDSKGETVSLEAVEGGRVYSHRAEYGDTGNFTFLVIFRTVPGCKDPIGHLGCMA